MAPMTGRLITATDVSPGAGDSIELVDHNWRQQALMKADALVKRPGDVRSGPVGAQSRVLRCCTMVATTWRVR